MGSLWVATTILHSDPRRIACVPAISRKPVCCCPPRNQATTGLGVARGHAVLANPFGFAAFAQAHVLADTTIGPVTNDVEEPVITITYIKHISYTPI
jgi:hypothetical protein